MLFHWIKGSLAGSWGFVSTPALKENNVTPLGSYDKICDGNKNTKLSAGGIICATLCQLINGPELVKNYVLYRFNQIKVDAGQE